MGEFYCQFRLQEDKWEQGQLFGYDGDTSDENPWLWSAIKMYPLVNIQKTIENGHRNSGFTY